MEENSCLFPYVLQFAPQENSQEIEQKETKATCIPSHEVKLTTQMWLDNDVFSSRLGKSTGRSMLSNER